MRIVLISPRGPLYRHGTGIWKKSLRYAPLTLTALAALIPKELNAKVTLVDEGVTNVDLNLNADLIGISAITGTAPRAYHLADHFRSRNIPVVLGGVHPTLMPDEASKHADSVLVGYSEHTWPQLLRDFAAGALKECYTQETNFHLNNIPFPKRELLPKNSYLTMHTIEATRGCVHQCEFCVVPTAWGRPIQRPVKDVIGDIRQMDAKRVLFLDLNLIADMAYAKELFHALIPEKITWGGLATTTIAWDDELLNLAHKSGCRGLLLGFESLCQDSLKEAGKGFNKRKDYFYVVERLHERHIAIMGCFAFGFDHDTKDTFLETADFVIKACIDLPRFAILTPFPGTPLFKRLEEESRILTYDWELYDAQHVVFKPLNMSPPELLRGTESVWKHVYSIPSIAKRLLGSLTQPSTAILANLGYRFYAYNLHKYYTCDWFFNYSPQGIKTAL